MSAEDVARALVRAVSRLVATAVGVWIPGVGTSADATRRSACATLLSVMLVLVGCSAPEAAGLKVIVGARIEGPPAIEYSVVVIEDGRFRAVGPQATTPVPKGAQIIDGKGRVIGGELEIGKPADLVMRNAATGSVEGAMKNGVWVPVVRVK